MVFNRTSSTETFTKAQLLTKLKVKVRDTANERWDADEMSDALDEGYIDPAVAYHTSDSSLTASTSVQDYTIPATIDKVVKVAITDSGGFESNVSNTLWEQNGTNLFFKGYAPSAGTLVIYGLLSYDNDDTVPQEYAKLIMSIACRSLYENLQNDYVAGILMSDVTMPQIQSGLGYWESQERKARKQLGTINSRKGYKI